MPLRPTAYLGDRKDSLPAGHHLVPLVMQHVHEAVRLVATHELRHVAGQRGALGQADAVTWRDETEAVNTPRRR